MTLDELEKEYGGCRVTPSPPPPSRRRTTSISAMIHGQHMFLVEDEMGYVKYMRYNREGELVPVEET